ncbi:ATP-binding cassette domain-containing protein [bacterium AH-315-J21]|nr:ATP-binding cassette domain-containing protein [bacterium AH-315-J21]
MENISESQTIIEISPDFLRELSSTEEEQRSAGASGGAQPKGISIAIGTLTTVNSLSARTVAVLLRYLVGRKRPPRGAVSVLGHDLGIISKREILKLRRRLGVVGGEFDLIADLNVAQNLALPCMVRNLGRKQTQLRIERISEALHLEALLDEPVAQLGSIERRVTLIARALTHDPELLILEAPLSGLDSHWSAVIVEYFKRLTITGSTALFFHEYTGAFQSGASKGETRKNDATPREIAPEKEVDSSGFDRGTFGKNVSE